MGYIKEENFLISDSHLPFTAFINKNIPKTYHWHNYIELLYVIDGSAIISIENDEFDVSHNDFIIINSQLTHASSITKNTSFEILVIQFEPNVLYTSYNSLFESKYIIPFLKNEIIYPKLIKLNEHSKLKELLTEILEDFTNKGMGYEFNIKGNIYKIFSYLLMNVFKTDLQEFETKTQQLLRLKDLFEYVENNFSNELPINWAAKFVCMSYYYFCHFFKIVTGKTYIEYLNFVRLEEASMLLENSAHSIIRISSMCGFSSINYFNRLFKKEKGISPTTYRKQLELNKRKPLK